MQQHHLQSQMTNWSIFWFIYINLAMYNIVKYTTQNLNRCYYQGSVQWDNQLESSNNTLLQKFLLCDPRWESGQWCKPVVLQLTLHFTWLPHGGTSWWPDVASWHSVPGRWEKHGPGQVRRQPSDAGNLCCTTCSVPTPKDCPQTDQVSDRALQYGMHPVVATEIQFKVQHAKTFAQEAQK